MISISGNRYPQKFPREQKAWGAQRADRGGSRGVYNSESATPGMIGGHAERIERTSCVHLTSRTSLLYSRASTFANKTMKGSLRFNDGKHETLDKHESLQ